MDNLDREIYYGYKQALRQVKNALAVIADTEYNLGLPVILVDYKEWKVYYFENKYRAHTHLEERYANWDEEPPEGDDEDLILYHFVSSYDFIEYPHTNKNATLFRTIKGKNFYRRKTLVNFSQELIIHVNIGD